MEVDYIIVGLGLAGLSFASILEENNKSFVVYEDHSQNSSKVAGGMYNPVILKRFTPVWEGRSQLQTALPFYKKMEKRFKKKYDYQIDIFRLLNSVQEQNNWFTACDNPLLSHFMLPEINHSKIKGINSPFGFGRLQNTGRIDSRNLLKDYSNHLIGNGQLLQESFDYSQLIPSSQNICYQNISAKKIVFCEGFGMKMNPYFNKLPLKEVKGELLKIESEELQLDFLLKSSVFIMPIGENQYKVGATFNWNDKTLHPTIAARDELASKLKTILTVPFEIVDQVAGIRPTVKDRRPLVGVDPIHTNIAILNGLGTRGVMIAPTMAQTLYDALESGKQIPKDVNINRFD